MIKNSDVTFVIQGPVLEYTRQSISSIKKYFPNSKIILSCWDQDQTNNINVNKVVKSKDPGGLKAKTNGGFVNVLRQKITTLKGLKKSTTLYSAKLRSDMIFEGKNLIKEYSNIKKLKRNKIFYDQRVLILENGSINPRAFYQLPFHFGDWFYFGLTKDLLKMFNFKFSKKDEILNAFYYKKKKFPENNLTKKYFLRYQPETIFTYFPIKKNFAKINNSYDIRKNNIFLSETFLINDFKIVSEKNIKIKNLKHGSSSIMTKFVRYTDSDWKILYKSFYSKKKKYFIYFFNLKTFLKKNISYLIYISKRLK